MKVYGLTGSIASGKTTVSRLLKKKGLPVLCADEVAHRAIRPQGKAYQKIVKTFGKEILKKDKTINRAILGKIVFENIKKRKKLNAIVHPQVRNDMALWLKKQHTLKKKAVVLDIPLLFESGLDKLCHHVIVVYTPEKHMLKRLIKRNKFKTAEAKSRISSQMSIELKKKRADFVIDNSGTLAKTKKQVDTLIKTML
ncbi:dephospho-CoA kinase [bacterium]|nr:dephospho-CoA kinase [bacterium]